MQDNKTIEKLPEFIEGFGDVSGYSFERVLELNGVYVYRIFAPYGVEDMVDVFVPTISPVKIKGTNQKIEGQFKETYPSSSQFGNTAFQIKADDNVSLLNYIDKLTEFLKRNNRC